MNADFSQRAGIGWLSNSYGRKHGSSVYSFSFEANKTASDEVRFFLIQVNID